MVAPKRANLTCGDGNLTRLLGFLDQPDELIDGHIAAIDCLVTDHDGINVWVPPRQIKRRADLPLVADLVLASDVLPDPRADRDLEAEFSGDRGNQSRDAARRIGSNRPGVGSNGLEVGANTRGGLAFGSLLLGGALPGRLQITAGGLGGPRYGGV